MSKQELEMLNEFGGYASLGIDVGNDLSSSKTGRFVTVEDDEDEKEKKKKRK